jgi:hypothetical protein
VQDFRGKVFFVNRIPLLLFFGFLSVNFVFNSQDIANSGFLLGSTSVKQELSSFPSPSTGGKKLFLENIPLANSIKVKIP